MRLRTLPLAASCIVTGNGLALHSLHHSSTTSFSWAVFGLTLLTTFLLQVLSNLANDYGDFSNGVDNDGRVGPERAMQSGAIAKSQMQKGLAICSALAFISGVSLLWIALASGGMFYSAIALLLVGVVSIAAAFKYTVGKNPYGYRGLGDIAVIVFFGFVGVMGSNFLQTHTWDLTMLLPSLTIGCLSAAVLNLNNLRDHINDAASNKNTLIVKIGFEKGKVYHYALFIVSFVSLASYLAVQQLLETKSWIALMVFVLFIPHLKKVRVTKVPAELDSQLKVVALLTFLLSLVIFVLV